MAQATPTPDPFADLESVLALAAETVSPRSGDAAAHWSADWNRTETGKNLGGCIIKLRDGSHRIVRPKAAKAGLSRELTLAISATSNPAKDEHKTTRWFDDNVISRVAQYKIQNKYKN